MPESLGYSSNANSYDMLFAGDFPVVSESVVILAGQNIARGDVLGKDGDGKYLLSLSAATDGSETPIAIAGRAIDATLADSVGIVYLSGEYNVEQLVFGTGHTAASVKDGLRALSIFLKSPVKA